MAEKFSLKNTLFNSVKVQKIRTDEINKMIGEFCDRNSKEEFKRYEQKH